jgi:predicted CXXCH cytochrome family protein
MVLSSSRGQGAGFSRHSSELESVGSVYCHKCRCVLAIMLLAINSIGFKPAMAQGIDATKHDLTGGGVSEICVFCHTPHGANAAVEAPLWNKLASSVTYTTYDSTTIDGDILAVGSVSIACLACHDGSQSTDVVINGPGAGNSSPAGVALRGGDRFLDPGQSFTLGTDLSNDHAIGVQYGGFGATPVDPDFRTGVSVPGLQVATVNGAQRWWVDTPEGSVATRDKTDIILYTRDNTGNPGGLAEEPFVECASCHDPHTENETFLRVSNTDSALCLACHVK